MTKGDNSYQDQRNGVECWENPSGLVSRNPGKKDGQENTSETGYNTEKESQEDLQIRAGLFWVCIEHGLATSFLVWDERSGPFRPSIVGTATGRGARAT